MSTLLTPSGFPSFCLPCPCRQVFILSDVIFIDQVAHGTSRERHQSAPYLRLNETGTSKVGAMSHAQKAQLLKYAENVFMKNSVLEP